MYELYRKQEKGGCQLQIFPFPPKYWIGFQFCGGGRGGGGEVSMPQVSIDQTREIYTSFIFFFQMALSDLNHARDTHCQITVLYSLFIPFCTSYTCNFCF